MPYSTISISTDKDVDIVCKVILFYQDTSSVLSPETHVFGFSK